MTDFFVSNEQRIQVREIIHFKDDIKKHSVDFNMWVDDNATVTGVTWTVESGQASISNESLTSNKSTITVTTTESGFSMLKAVATDGTHSEAVYIRLRAKDPQTEFRDDYWNNRWCW